MKKSNLKSLNLNKKSISNLNPSKIYGRGSGLSGSCGEDTTTIWTLFATCGVSNLCNQTDICPSEGVACKQTTSD